MMHAVSDGSYEYPSKYPLKCDVRRLWQ